MVEKYVPKNVSLSIKSCEKCDFWNFDPQKDHFGHILLTGRCLHSYVGYWNKKSLELTAAIRKTHGSD